MFCKKCGAELPDSVKFCFQCGSPTTMTEPEDDEKTVFVGSTLPEAADQEPVTEVQTEYMPQPEPVSQPKYVPQPEPIQPEPAPQSVPEVHQYADPVSPYVPPVKKKKKKTWLVILIIALVLLIGAGVGGFLFFTAQSNAKLYDEAQAMLAAKDYDGAMAKLEELGSYEDAEELLEDLTEKKENYANAQAMLTEKDYEGAKDAFEELGDYADSADMAASGVDYQKALYLKECAVAADAAGLSVLYGEGDIAVSDDPADISVSLYNGAAELLLALGEYSDANVQAMSCYHAAGILEAERGNYDAALAYKALMDEASAEAFDAEFLNYCADGTVLADMEAALLAREAVNATEEYEYNDLIQAELDYLEAYQYEYFADTELRSYVLQYIEGLYDQRDALDLDYDYIADEVLWYTGMAIRMGAIEDLNESYGFLNDNPDLKAEMVGYEDLAWSYAAITEVLYEYMVGVAPSVDDNGNYYMTLKNTTDYTFDLDYMVECYEGSTCVFSSDVETVNVPAGSTVKVPLEFPEAGNWDWYIYWDFYNIYLNGVQLDAE